MWGQVGIPRPPALSLGPKSDGAEAGHPETPAVNQSVRAFWGRSGTTRLALLRPAAPLVTATQPPIPGPYTRIWISEEPGSLKHFQERKL